MIKPDYADAYNNMGITFQDLYKLEDAIDARNKAIVLKPDYAKHTTTWAMLSDTKISLIKL